MTRPGASEPAAAGLSKWPHTTSSSIFILGCCEPSRARLASRWWYCKATTAPRHDSQLGAIINLR
eukprot:scaffold13405_cov49-Prasinocladus_malaysianus.AAC.1